MKSKLVDLCTIEDEQSVDELLNDQLVTPGQNFEALKKSCIVNNMSLVNRLIEFGEDPSDQNDLCLHIACSHGNQTLVERLAADPRVDLNGMDGMSLKIASKRDDMKLIKFLLDREIPFKDEILTNAIRQNNFDLVELSLKFTQPGEEHFDMCHNNRIYKRLLRHVIQTEDTLLLQKCCKLHLVF